MSTITAEDTTLSILDRTVDVDSHEMAPTHLWAEMFGPNSAELATAAHHIWANGGINTLYRPGLADEAEITLEAVWNTRGPDAPGAFDLKRRLEVLDTMGTERQLIFPTAAVVPFMIMAGGDSSVMQVTSSEDSESMLAGVISEYNDWAIRMIHESSQRLRLAVLLTAPDLESLMAEGRRLVAAGARAIWLPTAVPPGGRSPADPELDPFWSLMAENNVTVALHIGTEHGFRASEKWREAPAFAVGKVESTEILMEPYSATTQHTAADSYLTVMVLGGVFERHPELRFGALELGAHWLGPLAEHLDAWAGSVFRKRMSSVLSMPPSAYFARNVRVTPFYFEPIDIFLDRHRALADCYCYATDYPHHEGGIDSKLRYFEKVKPFGEAMVEKFFVTNGLWLVPD